MNIYLTDENETLHFGEQLALACPKHCIIFLQGELGAGKTTLVRGFLQALGYQGIVKSPTYTLVEPYEIQQRFIYHFDLYRIKDPQELEFIGINDYLQQKVLLLIEWPERAKEMLPAADLTCYIQHLSLGRQCRITAHTECGTKVLETLSNAQQKIKK